jgi:hypothetical protein
MIFFVWAPYGGFDFHLNLKLVAADTISVVFSCVFLFRLPEDALCARGR